MNILFFMQYATIIFFAKKAMLNLNILKSNVNVKDVKPI